MRPVSPAALSAVACTLLFSFPFAFVAFQPRNPTVLARRSFLASPSISPRLASVVFPLLIPPLPPPSPAVANLIVHFLSSHPRPSLRPSQGPRTFFCASGIRLQPPCNIRIVPTRFMPFPFRSFFRTRPFRVRFVLAIRAPSQRRLRAPRCSGAQCRAFALNALLNATRNDETYASAQMQQRQRFAALLAPEISVASHRDADRLRATRVSSLWAFARPCARRILLDSSTAFEVARARVFLLFASLGRDGPNFRCHDAVAM